MRLLGHLIRQSASRLLAAIFAGLVGGLSGAGLVTVLGWGITGSGNLASLGIAFFGLCTLTVASRIASENLLLRCTQDMALQVRMSLSRRLIETPLDRLRQLGGPELLLILTQDVENFAMVARTLPRVFGNAILITACMAYLAWLSPMLFAIILVYLLAGVVATQLAERAPLRKLKAARMQVNGLHAHFRGLIDGSRELKLNAARADMFVDDVIGPTARQFRTTVLQAMNGYSLVANTGSILFYLAIGLTLFILPQWVAIDHDVMLRSMVVLLYLVQPLTELIGMLPLVGQARIAYGRIGQLDERLGAPPKLRSGADPFGSPSLPHIALQGVRYRYGTPTSDGFRFGPVDLDIAPGDIVFIVGGNGSGKTTLALLLLGLIEPEDGWLELNGVRVGANNLEHYRARFSAIFYDFYLFEHILNDGSGEALQRARRYIDDFGLADKVQLIGERFSSTTALSNGQRRRLALVSAYAEDRPVYLFDEWAADQDPEFRKVFYSRLLPELKRRGKTVIVVTHDDRYFGEADRVIHLEDGRLAADAGGGSPGDGAAVHADAVGAE
jgi:putative pyoverdin transport system ATP-binding/permease protein